MISLVGGSESTDVGQQAVVGESRFVGAVLGAIIVLQRFALPLGGGQIPIALPIVLVAVAWAVAHRILVVEPVRRQLYFLALISCVLATTLVHWQGRPWSPLSIMFLAATYVPFMFRLRRPTAQRYHAFLSLFHGLMTVAAVVGIVQVGVQFLGMGYSDPFEMLPSAVVLQGYITSYPVVYGSSIFKANGVFFLEPSFYSQFLALALVIHVYLRRRGVSGYLLMAALVASVSGTGIILAVVGVLALGLTERRRQLVRLSGGIVVAAVLVVLSPAGSIFTSRIDESSSSTSSASGRFIVPYDLTASKLSADATSLLAGQGPGAAERISKQLEEETGVTAVFPVVPKLATEYGVPAMVVFLGFILTAMLRGVPSVPLAVPLLFMYFTLSGSLLQPVTVYAAYALTSMFAGDRLRSPDRSPPERRPPAPVTAVA